MAFDKPFDPELFKVLNPIHVSGKSQLFTVILKGDKKELKEELDKFNPLLNEHGNVSLEEIYVYELEEKQ